MTNLTISLNFKLNFLCLLVHFEYLNEDVSDTLWNGLREKEGEKAARGIETIEKSKPD